MNRNTNQETQDHANKVLDAMRKAMEDVPIEKRKSVMSVIYQTIGKAHYRVKGKE